MVPAADTLWLGFSVLVRSRAMRLIIVCEANRLSCGLVLRFIVGVDGPPPLSHEKLLPRCCCGRDLSQIPFRQQSLGGSREFYSRDCLMCLRHLVFQVALCTEK